jgi:hypothetical protein
MTTSEPGEGSFLERQRAALVAQRTHLSERIDRVLQQLPEHQERLQVDAAIAAFDRILGVTPADQSPGPPATAVASEPEAQPAKTPAPALAPQRKQPVRRPRTPQDRGRRVTEEQIDAAMRELGAWQNPRLAERLGVKRELASDLSIERVKQGKAVKHGGHRGPTSFFTWHEYTGPVDLTTARGGIPWVPGFLKAKVEPEPEPTAAEVKVRDFVQKAGPNAKVPVMLVAGAKRLEAAIVRKAFATWVERGAFEALEHDEAGNPSVVRFAKPTEPGAAATFDARRRPAETPRNGAAEPVAGTGQKTRLTADKDAAKLIDQARAQGATADKTGGGEVVITAPGGQKVYMAATPSSPALDKNRKDLREAGITV